MGIGPVVALRVLMEGGTGRQAIGFSFAATREGQLRQVGCRFPSCGYAPSRPLPWAVTGLQVTPAACRQLAEENSSHRPRAGRPGWLSGAARRIPARGYLAARPHRPVDRPVPLSYAPSAAPDGTPALAAEVMLSMTGGSPIVAIAELRIEDAAAWQAALLASEAGTAARSPDARCPCADCGPSSPPPGVPSPTTCQPCSLRT